MIKKIKDFKEQKKVMLWIAEQFILNEKFEKDAKKIMGEEISLLKTLFTYKDYYENQQDLKLLNSIYNKFLAANKG